MECVVRQIKEGNKMTEINNLNDLKKYASNDTIIKCLTEFIMEIYGEYNSHDKNFVCNYQVKKEIQLLLNLLKKRML